MDGEEVCYGYERQTPWNERVSICATASTRESPAGNSREHALLCGLNHDGEPDDSNASTSQHTMTSEAIRKAGVYRTEKSGRKSTVSLDTLGRFFFEA